MLSFQLNKAAFLLMQNTSYQFIFGTMHRELGAQFLLTRMEIAHVSFLPAQHRINNHKCGTGNARQITLLWLQGVRGPRLGATLNQRKYFSAVAVPPIYHLQD